ncbi:MAG TPA: GNAT family N-acetyltransferase [Nocardiopsis listeri]|uniref:GNAT family N-acetyltransferase n=1 Tax=Nocardiopsis listeri TaxID=53440 RepID=UPI001D822FE0|nr:GNAT family N-acetyltransferase [Nocardiopsis listeri]HJE58973.1 GNAT family N-acetyltransferase [Nocardiopsis listeri]
MDHERPDVRLVPLDRATPETTALRKELLDHELPPEQLRFTGLPAQTLPEADADPARLPYAIVVGEAVIDGEREARARCAGFGVLDANVGALPVDAPERAVLMRAYYVTPQWQGRGVGRTSCAPPLLDRSVSTVAPNAEKIVLCVNRANLSAQRAYAAAGFAFTGNIVPGNAGPQYVMARPLDIEVRPEPRPRHRRTENPQ